MNVKRYLKTVALGLCSWAIASPLGAEVFTESYSTTLRESFDQVADMIVGAGVEKKGGSVVDNSSSADQVGLFTNLKAKAIPAISNGVVFCTGTISDGISLDNTVANCAWSNESKAGASDPDLNNCTSDNLSDPAGIVLYVQPKNKTLNVPFLLASEDFFYTTSPNPDINKPTLKAYANKHDKFAVMLKELGDASAGVVDSGELMSPENNIARFPDGGVIGIATVNQHTNTEYFVSNVTVGAEGALIFPAKDINLPMEYNGAIVGPSIVAKGLNSSKIYKLKIVIGDDYDNTGNTALFIPECGITSGADLKIVTVGTEELALPGTVYYTNTVSNIGPAPADGVVVTNYLPVGFKSGNLAIEACDGGSVGEVFDLNGTNCFVWTVGDDFQPGSNAVLRFSCTLATLPPTGLYTNIATVATSTGDYDESNNSGQCETFVGELPELVITAIDVEKVYGEPIDLAAKAFIDSADGLPLGKNITGIKVAFTNENGEAAYPTNAAAAVGSYGIVLSEVEGLDLNEFKSVTYVGGTVTVKPMPLAITAKDAKKAYGETLSLDGAAFTLSAPLPNGEAISSVTLTCPEAADPMAAADDYVIDADIEVVGIDTNNYAITFVDGTLSVTQRVLTITANNASKFYGETKTLDGMKDFEVAGLVNGDKVTSVTLICDGLAAGAAIVAEGYPITPSNPQGSGLANYTIVPVDGKLSIGKQTIKVAARNKSKPYGQKLFFNGITGWDVVSGTLAPGDSVTNVTLTSSGAAADAACGTEYPIVVGKVLGEGLENYFVETVNGKLSVTKRSLKLKAKDATKRYGEELMLNDFEIAEGKLYNSDTVTSVTLTSDGAPATAPVLDGGYPITITAGSEQGSGLGNYDISYDTGTLTVTPRAIVVAPKQLFKWYGDTVATNGAPLFAGTELEIVDGELVNNDRVISATLSSPGTVATAVCREGGYPITIENDSVQGEGLENYVVRTLAGNLEVLPRKLTVTVDNQTKTYGETLEFAGDEFTVTEGNLVNGDKLTWVKLESEGAAKTKEVKVGGYPITATKAGGSGLTNYDITYIGGTLTVTPRKITVTPRNATKKYGETLTFNGDELVISSGTLVKGDAVSSAAISSVGQPATASWQPNGYPIVITPGSITGVRLENYDITCGEGRLTVTRRPLTITAKDATKVYGEELEFDGTEFKTEGELQNGDTVASVTFVSEKAAAAGTEVGFYSEAIAPGHVVTGINTNNYNISFVNGNLTVTKAELKIYVNEVYWKVGKERPAYSFADFSSQLKADDTMADITGGTGSAADVVFTNVVWTADAPAPTEADEDRYEDEIWIDARSIDGVRIGNYDIELFPGALSIVGREAILKVTMEAVLNRATGLMDITLTIVNEGDGKVPADYDYWVELLPGPAAEGAVSSVARSYYLSKPTGTMPDGYEYLLLNTKVKTALKKVGNLDEEFNPGETIKFKAASVYHWLRWNPSEFIDSSKFFVAGKLFNAADTDQNFVIDAAELQNVASWLETDVEAYLEVTKLALLDYYVWNVKLKTWDKEKEWK